MPTRTQDRRRACPQKFTDKEVPAYTILSYTWHANNKQKVTLQDIKTGTGKSKAGWKKIDFYTNKAAADSLRYFWIDTCCIDEKNAVELAAAINSIFRLYQKAAQCYVYLSDVSIQDEGLHKQVNPAWEAAFRKCR